MNILVLKISIHYNKAYLPKTLTAYSFVKELYQLPIAVG